MSSPAPPIFEGNWKPIEGGHFGSTSTFRDSPCLGKKLNPPSDLGAASASGFQYQWRCQKSDTI